MRKASGAILAAGLCVTFLASSRAPLADEKGGARSVPTETAQDAESEESQADGDTARAEPPHGLDALAPIPTFVPPSHGAPRTRVGGGTRGISSRDLPELRALVPEQTGLTLEEQPTLYWYLSKPTSHALELTLRDMASGASVLETALPAPAAAGVQRIRLSDYDVGLPPGASWRWFVRLLPDPKRPSAVPVAGGGIERVEADEDLRKRLADASPERAAFILAEAAIWYDALDALSEQIDASPGNADLREQRAGLLKQVGLTEIAESELAAARDSDLTR